MDHRSATAARSTPDATEFVRFCYRRRSVGWPELYDEMWLVASRRLFRGFGPGELADLGIGFSLSCMPILAELAATVIAEEQATRPRPTGYGIRSVGRGDHAAVGR
jgi:hypothetical protein